MESIKPSLIAALLFIVSCTSAKYDDKKFDISDLKGRNCVDRDNPCHVKPYSLMLRSEVLPTLIRGRVVKLVPGDDLQYPLRFVRVKLSGKSRVLIEGSTDNEGDFSFTLNIEKGLYNVSIDSATYVGGVDLKVEKNRHEGVLIVAKPKSR